MDKRAYWLWLTVVFGAASPRLWRLGDKYETAEEFAYALRANECGRLSDGEIRRIKSFAPEKAEEIIEKCSKDNITVYCYESEGYPGHLKKIADPPAVLFCKGNPDFLNNKPAATIAGSRTPSEYSKAAVRTICGELCACGCSVITGLAEGIDQLAAQAALESEAYVCGVCGRDIDADYPKGSGELKARICEKGAIISETCSYMNSPPVSFTKRNRILVGISDALVFIECSENSRGLDNVRHAVSQGKQIFAVPPHDIADGRYFGQRDLLRKGCKPIFGGEDFVYYVSASRIEDFSFDVIGGKYSSTEDSAVFKNSGDSELKPKPAKKRSAAGRKADDEKTERHEVKRDYSALTSFQADICRTIESGPMLADNVAERLGADISEVLSELTVLELDGYVSSLPGKMFGIA
ncbi:DNA-processing protein DprA [Ruminococcus sp. Marseille-P6503]|uniref:DNA-processing protein DprA n=1 Tax=Ruminococcus sp. Marseille-P6503 TaxID=2364796 RepID=UPI000F52C2A7|nr:DNA-processing protein DprA [Ruminococcus sp. Marseille-P6503]